MKKLKKAEMVRRGQVGMLAACCDASVLANLMQHCLPAPPAVCIHLQEHIDCIVTVKLSFLVFQIDHVRAERDVLAEVHNPYVVKLYYSFQVRLL